jgi:transcription-repair coupling factor (superfamily II helicase)
LGARSRRSGLTDITLQGNHIRFAPVELPESKQVRVQRLYPKTLLKPAVRTMLVPVPKAVPGSSSAGASRGRSPASGAAVIGGQPLRDRDMLAWCTELIEGLFGDPASPAEIKA